MNQYFRIKKREEGRQFKDRNLCLYSFYSLMNWDDNFPPCISFLKDLESLEIVCRNWVNCLEVVRFIFVEGCPIVKKNHTLIH
jgi:hypothetical protein